MEWAKKSQTLFVMNQIQKYNIDGIKLRPQYLNGDLVLKALQFLMSDEHLNEVDDYFFQFKESRNEDL